MNANPNARMNSIGIYGLRRLDQSGRPKNDVLNDPLLRDSRSAAFARESRRSVGSDFDIHRSRLPVFGRQYNNGTETARFWPSHKQMRPLFKQFDEDSVGELTGGQLKRGLERIGITVTDQVAFNNLVTFIDRNNKGKISENDFIQAFRLLAREELQSMLTSKKMPSLYSAVGGSTEQFSEDEAPFFRVVVCDLGVHEGKGIYKSTEVSVEDLSAILSSPPTLNGWHTRWVDVEGIQINCLTEVWNALELPRSAITDIQQNVENEVEFHSQEKTLHISLGAVTMVNLPIRRTKKKPFGDYKLVSHHEYKAFRHLRLHEQKFHIFVKSPSLIVTVRRRKELECDNPFGSSMFNDVNTYLNAAMKKESQPPLISAHKMVQIVVEEIGEMNWVMCDSFRDWKVTLENSIRKAARNKHLEHIVDLKTCAQQAVSCFEHNLTLLDQIAFNIASAEREVHDGSTVDFHEVIDSYQLIAREGRETVFLATSLNEFFTSRQHDKVNRILLWLTLLNTFLAPMQIITGIYGMNFTEMPELHHEWGYPLFWIVNAVIVIIMFIVLRKWRWTSI